MSNRYWLPDPPIGVGLIVFTLLFGVAILEHEKKYAACRQDSPAQNCDRTFEYVGHAAITPIDTVKAPDRNQNPQREEWRNEQDLQAQWDMSRWAFWSAFAASIGVLITGVGVFYVRQTLEATRAAVEEAREGTKAANAAVQVTRDMAARELRAYVGIEITGLEFQRGANNAIGCKVRYTLRNFGQTPAYNVRVDSDFRLAPAPLLEDFAPPIKNAMDFNAALNPGETSGGTIEKGQSLDGRKAGDKLYIFAVVRYRDIFAMSQDTWFCAYVENSDELLFDPPPGIRNIKIDLKKAERHNNAT